MSRIPKDITPVIREIDEELKAEGVRPLGRPMNAIIKFGHGRSTSIQANFQIQPFLPRSTERLDDCCNAYD